MLGYCTVNLCASLLICLPNSDVSFAEELQHGEKIGQRRRHSTCEVPEIPRERLGALEEIQVPIYMDNVTIRGSDARFM